MAQASSPAQFALRAPFGAESSNRIEGVAVSPERLRPVVIGKVKPRGRSEAELAGYRRALDWIFSRKGSIA